MSYLDFPLPPPWVRGLLVLVFLGFGVFVGNVTSSSGGTLSASAQPHLRLVLPPAGAGGSGPSAPAIPSTPASSAPPPALAEATPDAATPKGTSTTTARATPSQGASQGSSGAKGSGGGGSGSSGGESGSGSQEGAGSGEGSSGGGGSAGATGKLPAVKHVFLIVLADQPYAAVFGPASKASYLSHTLEKRGELLVRYYAVAHDELANGIALLSGQGPTAQTATNCPAFGDISSATVGAEQQVAGDGCVYPRSTETLAGQLSAKRLTWRAYVEGMEGACTHPALGAADPTVGTAPPSATPNAADQAPPANQAAAGASYTTFRNPFVYFHSIIDSPACAADDVGLGQLGSDLSSAKHTPNFSYIVPSLCDDGSSTPCAPGHAAGLPAADSFLQKVVPQILASKAYKDGGLLAITVDQAPATGIEADSSSCCGQPRFPALPAPTPLPGGGQLPPSGGGQVGALLLSPFVKAGTVNQDPYNHFGLLRTLEDLFGLKHLGYAAATGVSSFGASVFDGAP